VNSFDGLDKVSFKRVIKNNGAVEDFDWEKIVRSVMLAGKETNAYGEAETKKIIYKIIAELQKIKSASISTVEIRNIIEPAIAEAGFFKTAKYYILYPTYRDQAKKAALTAEIKEYTDASKKYFRNQLSELVYYQMYSRWRNDLGRRETWIETVNRFVGYMEAKLKGKLSQNDYTEVREAILNMKVIPSMRLLWSAGKSAESSNVIAYNCSFVAPQKIEDFGEIMYIMMCGTGVGFSVEQKLLDKLPSVKIQIKSKIETITVNDSKEGWAKALVAGMKAWFDGRDVDFDYSLIRPQGALINTMGGRASGPESLKETLTFTRSKILGRQGGKLNTLDVHDIICKIGEIVLAGGVRRNSMISLSDLNDESMRNAKTGQFYDKDPQRAMANNSAIYTGKPSTVEFMEEWLSLAKSGTGERGLFNRGGLKNNLPSRRWEKFEKYADSSGTNPCGEIILRSKQFCNLTAIVVRPEDTEKSLLQKTRIASIIGTFQASLTNFPYLSEDWKKNSVEEALLGVSFTGYWDNDVIRRAKVLKNLKETAVDVNRKYAKKIGINSSTCVTCVKPSGNSSQLLDTASGLHPRYANYYIRRVRVSATDPLFKMLKDQGVKLLPEVGQDMASAKQYVIEFPVKAPANAVVKDDIGAIELLEEWKKIKTNFTEHNPSATIYVGEDEWLEVGNWVYANWDIIGGLTFLPRTNHVYKLAPYEEINKKEYESRVKEMPFIDFSQLVLYESDDHTESAKELACVSGACEI
jgi:ribonucleoside-diphosphate reductase alpha chain